MMRIIGLLLCFVFGCTSETMPPSCSAGLYRGSDIVVFGPDTAAVGGRMVLDVQQRDDRDVFEVIDTTWTTAAPTVAQLHNIEISIALECNGTATGAMTADYGRGLPGEDPGTLIQLSGSIEASFNSGTPSSLEGSFDLEEANPRGDDEPQEAWHASARGMWSAVLAE